MLEGYEFPGDAAVNPEHRWKVIQPSEHLANVVTIIQRHGEKARVICGNHSDPQETAEKRDVSILNGLAVRVQDNPIDISGRYPKPET